MLNVIVLAGNVVSDPKTRETTGGKSVSTVRIAVNNPMNDTEVLFIDVDVWDKQSEFVQKFVKKGSSVSTQGRLRSREWTDKDGVKRTNFSVVADKINFLGSKKKDGVAPNVDAEPNQTGTPAVVSAATTPTKEKKVAVIAGEDKEPFDDVQF